MLNSERLKTVKGEGKNITGYAYIPDPKQPGKLKVHLEGTFFDAPCKYVNNINNKGSCLRKNV